MGLDSGRFKGVTFSVDSLRNQDMTSAMIIKPHDTRNARLRPATKASRMSLPLPSEMAAKLGSNPIDAIMKVTIVVAMAMPVTLAVVLVIFKNAETLPYFLGSAAPITALVLGEEKVPIPIPASVRPIKTW